MNNGELLTTSQVAEIKQVSERTIARWVRLGKLAPVAKAPGIRGAYLFRAEDVNEQAA